MNDKIMEFAKRLNETEYINNISIPILDNFKTIKTKGALFTAVSNEGYVEQFLTDGIIGEGENLETHINKVIAETKDAMRKVNMEQVDTCINFCKDYKNKDFTFKIYSQDNILNDRYVRQLNIYFIDEKTRAFYEITFATSPFALKDMEYVKEHLTLNMLSTINNMLDYVTYK